MTGRGILLFYNGADDQLQYGPGWVLFDRRDPARVVARAERPLLSPKLDWEMNGNVPNVIFLEGAITQPNPTGHNGLNLIGYYGAADKFIGGARIHVTGLQ